MYLIKFNFNELYKHIDIDIFRVYSVTSIYLIQNILGIYQPYVLGIYNVNTFQVYIVISIYLIQHILGIYHPYVLGIYNVNIFQVYIILSIYLIQHILGIYCPDVCSRYIQCQYLSGIYRIQYILDTTHTRYILSVCSRYILTKYLPGTQQQVYTRSIMGHNIPGVSWGQVPGIYYIPGMHLVDYSDKCVYNNNYLIYSDFESCCHHNINVVS